MLQLHFLLFMLLFVVGLTTVTAVPSMLASHWDALLRLSVCFVQLLGLFVVFLNLTISRIICVTYSTGFLFLSAFKL